MVTLGLGLGLRARTGASAAGLTGPQVVLLAGQSNMVGRDRHDGGSVHPPGTLMWGRFGAADNTLVPVSIPLDHHDPITNGMGPDLTFSIDFL
ncbi:MAG: hypothetical protein AAF501_01400, partial [Pseudomonadota bacterium]